MDPLMTLYFIVWALAMLTMILEGGLNLAWDPSYFTSGILIYRKEMYLHRNVDISLSFCEVQARVEPNYWHGSIEFERLDNKIFGIRYKPFEFRFFSNRAFPSMRTTIWHDPESGAAEIRGYLSWGYLAWYSILPMGLVMIIENGLSILWAAFLFCLGTLFFLSLFFRRYKIGWSPFRVWLAKNRLQNRKFCR
jgi:hypothetical protein